MSDYYFDTTQDFNDNIKEMMKLHLINYGNARVTPPVDVTVKEISLGGIKDYSSNDDNLVFKCLYEYDCRVYRSASTSPYIGRYFHSITKLSSKIELEEGTRWCLLRFKVGIGNAYFSVFPNDKVDSDLWLWVSNTNTGATVTKQANPEAISYEPSIYADSGELSSLSVTTGTTHRPLTNTTNLVATNPLTRYTSANFTGSYYGLSSDQLANINTLLSRLIADSSTNPKHCAVMSANPVNHQIYGGLVYANVFTTGALFYSSLEKIPDFIPVFDATDESDTNWIDNAYDFLINNNRHGDVDPFANDVPKKETVNDYRSNFKMFLSPSNDSNITHFSIACYNNDYNLGGEEMKDNYKMVVKRAYDLGAWETLTESHVPYTPVYSFDYEFPKTDRQTSIRVYFADNDETSTSTIFDVVLLRDNNSRVNCKVNVVNQTNNDYDTCDKTNIVDGARYFANTGEYIDVLFRGIGINDLKDGYSEFPDTEDSKSGTDSDFFGASGLHTFAIDNTDLATINKKLWSTDWSTVFKSNTIDPIKSIIGCKAIPFNADNVSSTEIIIANLNTGISKNYVKTVKSYNIGTCVIEPLYKDFTDVSLTRIHCYLPFIGWVELPTSEVMSRYEYASYGISARIKTLGFKYLVDFVDGSVKVIISVNNTERWLFDGNCAVDVPLTSDNHTQAVRNAIQSAISTTMSIGSIVAGAYSGNAGAVAGGVVGTITNAPDIFPTYNYSASATGGGAIVQSLNNHIMIVVERPNVQKPSNYAHTVGMPCYRVMSLSGLSGFTKCANVDVSGVNATPDELRMIKNLLENGVYL